MGWLLKKMDSGIELIELELEMSIKFVFSVLTGNLLLKDQVKDLSNSELHLDNIYFRSTPIKLNTASSAKRVVL